jgi:hypothetical protein
MKSKLIIAFIAALVGLTVLAQTNLPVADVGTVESVQRIKRDRIATITITEDTISASFERVQVDPATGEVIRVLSSGGTSRKISAIKSQQITDAITLLANRVNNWRAADIQAIADAKAAEAAAAAAAEAAAKLNQPPTP